MPDLLAQLTFGATSAIPKDATVMTFAIKDVNDLTTPTLEAINIAFEDMLNTVPTGGLEKPANYLASTISRAADACVIDLYDVTAHLDGSPHGSPVMSSPFQLAAHEIGGTDLPAEVAYCMTLFTSFRAGAPVEAPDGADPGGEVDRPKQRHTGRQYWGPLRSTAGTTAATGAHRPASTIRDTLRLAYEDLYDALHVPTGAGGGLAVWSRRDAVMRSVDGVFSDDAWDTQRRRGVAPTVRTVTDFV